MFNISENENGLFKYLDSSGLALNILESANNFVFFDLESQCLEAIQNYAKKIKIDRAIDCQNEDSIEVLIKMVENLDSKDFIHCDPYLIHEKNSNNNSYFDAFCLAMIQGSKGILWYGFNTIQERKFIHEVFRASNNINGKISLKGIEIISVLLDDHILEVNPGVLGCGILIGNLSDRSNRVFQEMAWEVVKLYRESSMFDRYSGELKLEEFEVKI